MAGDAPVEPRGLPDESDSTDFRDLFSARGSLDERRDRAPMLDLLWAAANTGTGRRAALWIPTFGKTGTTQDNRDAVFVGFAGDLVVGVWVGRDDDTSLGKISGGTVPARIWRDFMSSAISIDGRLGPPLPSTYRPQPEQERPAKHPSPLPEDWSDRTKALRRIGEALHDLFADR